MNRDLCSCRLNGSKASRIATPSPRLLSFIRDSRTSYVALRTLERLSSQLESLIVRTEFCHVPHQSVALLGPSSAQGWEVRCLSRYGGGAEEMLTRGEETALSCKFGGRAKAEKRHRLDSGAPGRLGRSVCTIMHGDYELSVGFKRLVGV